MVPTAVKPSIRSPAKDSKEKPHVLVCAIPAYGHFDKLRIIAADLVIRGYKVSFITGTCFRSSAEKTGASFIPLHGNADVSHDHLDEKWPDRRTLEPGPALVNFDLINCFMTPMKDQFECVQNFLADAAAKAPNEPIVIVQDPSFLGTFPPALGARGLRPSGRINVGIYPLAVSSVDTAPFNMGLPPDSSPEGRQRNAAMLAGFHQALGPSQAAWAANLAALGATDTSAWFLDQWVTTPDLFLQLSIPAIEYPRSDLPSTVRFIGALPAGHGEPHPLPAFWPEILAHKKRLVVVSQGTLSNDPADLVLPTLVALADMDVLVVATLVRADTLPAYTPPSNARVTRFIPFDALFAHADAVVSNGGYGTVCQALAAGVPLVLAGMTEDKPEVCARAAWTGAAINLKTLRPEAGVLREAVGRVLGEEGFGSRARALSVAFAKMDPLGDVVRAVEELGARGRGRE
ncbi:hypothetical protein MMC11_000376 [Xylographa trunciseda]|nr:hypothetical protein [Xylographa trunciseda]